MEGERTDSAHGQHQGVKEQYLAKVLPIIRHRGFSHLRIDEVARSMDISKATFYKHFSSKEDVIEGVVEMVVSYLNEMARLLGDDSSPYLERFQHTFSQSLLIASYLSEPFLLDLKQIFPPWWERVRGAQQERQRRVQHFYEQGIAAGVFQPMNATLVVLQDELILPAILDPVFLMEHDLTLRAALYDYYELQKYQWLAPEVSQQLNDAPVKEYIDMMARKISLSMRSDLAP